jgi:transcriptional regulator with XRE-family HTH domain
MITSTQSRVARALLAWSQQDLATEAKVGSSTVADFERGQRSPISNNIEAIKSAFDRNGVRFIADSAILEAGSIKIVDTTKNNQPIRWIDSTDLDRWADRRDAQSLFPELISRLLVATYGSGSILRFPSGDSVQFAGFDGISDFELQRHPVPAGKTVWELGTTNIKIKAKAHEDYGKRSKPAKEFDHSQHTFVFVTPRRWPSHNSWVAERNQEAIWREVRVIDADDLVHWLDQCPQVANWLATKIGKRPSGVQSLEERWSEWSNTTKPPFTTSLTLASRDEEATLALKWLRGPPTVFAVNADAADEAFGFVYSAICQLPVEAANAQLSRALVVNTYADARQLRDSASPLILCLTFIEPGLAQNLADNGHYVFVACVSNQAALAGAISLKRPDRYELKRLLVGMLSEIQQQQASRMHETEREIERKAERLAADAGRSLTILRRQMTDSHHLLPQWSLSNNQILIAALFAGGWNSAKIGDQQILETLSGYAYAEFEKRLVPYLSMADNPIVKSESAWRLSSPRDAFALLASQITETEITKFLEVFVTVMSSPDPRFKIEGGERWKAALNNIAPDFSPLLRRGLTEIATLLSVYHDRVISKSDCHYSVNRAVLSILGSADSELWWSLHQDLQLLAEAAPDAFLTSLESNLDAKPSPLEELFKEIDGPLGGEQYLSNLMWGLERLAWIKEFIPRVTDVLLRLSLLDKGGKSANRPSGTLRKMFLNWSPQCSLTLAERLEVIDSLRERYGNQSWPFLLSLAPKTHDMLIPAVQPQWRDFNEASEIVTYGVRDTAIDAIAERLLSDVGNDPGRWCEILEAQKEFSDEHRACFRQGLLTAIPVMGETNDSKKLLETLRRFIYRHREFEESDWALPEDELKELSNAIVVLEPKELGKNLAWLFQQRPPLPNPPPATDFKAHDEQAQTMRSGATKEIFAKEGFQGLIELAKNSKQPYLVGHAIQQNGLEKSEEIELLDQCFGYNDEAIVEIARGFIGARHYSDEQWCEAYLKHTLENGCASDQQVVMMLSWRFQRSTWDVVENLDEVVANAYWKKTDWRFWGNDTDCTYVAEKLLTVGRPRSAVNFLGSCLENTFSSSMIAEALAAAVNSTPEGEDGFGNEGTMFNWYLGNLFKKLDADSACSRDEIAKLEWAYFPLLEHTERQPRELPRLISNNPAFFVQLLSTVFRRADGKEDEFVMSIGEGQAEQAYNVLEHWNVLPGTNGSETIDEIELDKWILEARELSAEAGRLGSGDFCIGKLMGSIRPRKEGQWPPTAIRNLIEKLKSEKFESGFRQALYNGRGVTTRGFSDGGSLERDLAALYRQHAADCRVRFPRTAKILESMAMSYDVEGKRHDEDVIRQQW